MTRGSDACVRRYRADPLEFLARVLVHIPDKGHVTTRYYGWYANRPEASASTPELFTVNQRCEGRLDEALVLFLERVTHGTRGPVEASDARRYAEVRIGNDSVTVSCTDGLLAVWVGPGAKSLVVATIARKFDVALATHRYDRHFGQNATP